MALPQQGRAHAPQKLVQPPHQRRIQHVRGPLRHPVGRQLHQRQQHQQAQQETRTLLAHEARQKRKHQIKRELHRNRPRRPGNETPRSRRLPQVGEKQVQHIRGLEMVTPHRNRHEEEKHEQRKNAQEPIAHKPRIGNLPAVQGNRHEQKARQHEKQRHPRMPLHHPAQRRRIRRRLPPAKTQMEHMERQHQQRRQQAQMVEGRNRGEVVAVHGGSGQGSESAGLEENGDHRNRSSFNSFQRLPSNGRSLIWLDSVQTPWPRPRNRSTILKQQLPTKLRA